MSDTTAKFGFTQYDGLDPAALDTLINDAIQSIEEKLPLQFAATLSEISAMSGPLHPAGQVVILTADNSGVKAGAQFARAAGKWWFTGGQVANIDLFLGALGSNLGTQPGASFYDIGDAQPKVFISGTGAWRVTAPAPVHATVAKTTELQKLRTTVDLVTFQTLVEGDSRFFNSANPTYLTIPEDGRYVIRGQLRVNGGNIETAFAFSVNGVTNNYFFAANGDRGNVAWPTTRGDFEMDLEAGDQLSMLANRYGGVDTDITAHQTWIQIRKVE
jgi:hypothetical protein